jgi:hypothetical protein
MRKGWGRYNELSIISGSVAAIWLKTLSILASFTLETDHFRAYAQFSELLRHGSRVL